MLNNLLITKSTKTLLGVLLVMFTLCLNITQANPNSNNNTKKPNSSNDYYSYGVKAYNTSNFTNAIQYFKSALMLNQSNYNAMYYLALAYQQNKEYKNAATTYIRLAMLAPNEPQGKLAKQAMLTLGKQVKELKASGKLTPEFINSIKNGKASNSQNNQTANRVTNYTTNYAKNSTAMSCAPNSAMTSQNNKNNMQQIPSNDIRSLAADPSDNTPNEVKIAFEKAPNNLLYINAMVNNHAINFIFDSGAECCCISRTQLERIGVTPPSGPPNGIQVSGVGTQVNLATWTMKTNLKVGNMERHNFPIAVIDSPSLPGPLLGQNFWKGYQVSVDNSSNCIKLTKQGIKYSLGYAVPFKRRGNNIIVNVNINGMIIPMYFDTGASNISFSMKQAKMCHIDIDPNGSVSMSSGIGGNTKTYDVKISQLKIGPIELYDVPASVASQSNMDYPLLGQKVFGEGWEYIIDDKENVVRFVKR